MSRGDAITLRGMRFHVRVGILPHERELPQPLEIDLTVRLAPTASAATVVDYRELYALVADVVGGDELLHLETIGERIAEQALQVSRVEDVRVAVRKPHVPLPGPVAYAEIVIERS